MANASVKLQRTAHATQSVGNITAPGSGMRRFSIYDLIFGSEGDAADNEFLWQFQRCTSAGTRTAVTPQLLNPADAAVVTTAGQNHSAEPTYTADQIPLLIALNQRATFRWVAAPGGEIICPATANNGLGVLTPTMTAVAISLTAHLLEH